MEIWMLIFLSAAVVYDWRDFRIPNQLTGGAAVLTAVICFSKGLGAGDMIIGMLLPFITCIGLFYLRVLGGGDIKVLMVCGIPLGTYIIRLMILSFLWNGVYAVLFLWKQRNFHLRFSTFLNYISKCLESGRIIPYGNTERIPDESSSGREIHFSTGILLAYLSLLIGGVL